MKTNILKILLLIIITGSLTSCDDKIRELEDLNSAPEFQYFRKSSISWEIPKGTSIEDSAKMFTASNNATYPAILRIMDVNNNLSKINITSNDGQNSFFVNDNTYYNNYEVENNEQFNVAFRNHVSGTFIYKVFASDDFDKSTEVNFKITYKPNKPPKPLFSVVLVNGTTKTYQLVGHNSYDIDKAIGGTIVEYEFVIDNVIIKTSEPDINHVFTKGTHVLKFRVKDNDDVWSSYIDYNLTVV